MFSDIGWTFSLGWWFVCLPHRSFLSRELLFLMVKYIYFYLGFLALDSSVRPKKKIRYLLEKQHQKWLMWFSMCNSSHEHLVTSVIRRQVSQKHSLPMADPHIHVLCYQCVGCLSLSQTKTTNAFYIANKQPLPALGSNYEKEKRSSLLLCSRTRHHKNQ